MRGAPHVTLAVDMRRIRARTSPGTRGLPGPRRRLFQVQYLLKLVSESDNLDGHIGAVTDQGDNAMEERQKDSEHDVALCHAFVTPKYPRRRFAVLAFNPESGCHYRPARFPPQIL